MASEKTDENRMKVLKMHLKQKVAHRSPKDDPDAYVRIRNVARGTKREGDDGE